MDTGEKYKNKTIEGSTFPDQPISYSMKISFSEAMLKEYIPTIQKMNLSKGLMYLCIAMADFEGFDYGSRSYKTNNPGNIGNVDSGANNKVNSLEEGIKLQVNHLVKVANGLDKNYPVGKIRVIPPKYSAEIDKNRKTYKMSPYLPGYRFLYNGELEAFLKIYATGPRAGNNYISSILSYFKNLGISITPKTTLKDIISIQ